VYRAVKQARAVVFVKVKYYIIYFFFVQTCIEHDCAMHMAVCLYCVFCVNKTSDILILTSRQHVNPSRQGGHIDEPSRNCYEALPKTRVHFYWGFVWF